MFQLGHTGWYNEKNKSDTYRCKYAINDCSNSLYNDKNDGFIFCFLNPAPPKPPPPSLRNTKGVGGGGAMGGKKHKVSDM